LNFDSVAAVGWQAVKHNASGNISFAGCHALSWNAVFTALLVIFKSAARYGFTALPRGEITKVRTAYPRLIGINFIIQFNPL
jgi:hypothetical protein